jgi:hypothetical protein
MHDSGKMIPRHLLVLCDPVSANQPTLILSDYMYQSDGDDLVSLPVERERGWGEVPHSPVEFAARMIAGQSTSAQRLLGNTSGNTCHVQPHIGIDCKTSMITDEEPLQGLLLY